MEMRSSLQSCYCNTNEALSPTTFCCVIASIIIYYIDVLYTKNLGKLCILAMTMTTTANLLCGYISWNLHKVLSNFQNFKMNTKDLKVKPEDFKMKLYIHKIEARITENIYLSRTFSLEGSEGM